MPGLDTNLPKCPFPIEPQHNFILVIPSAVQSDWQRPNDLFAYMCV